MLDVYYNLGVYWTYYKGVYDERYIYLFIYVVNHVDEVVFKKYKCQQTKWILCMSVEIVYN